MDDKTLTNRELKEKYPIGTKVKYIGFSKWDDTGDRGKTGVIVNYNTTFPIIFLPKSTHISEYSTKQVPATWETGWDSIEILAQKNQQLLFSFMD